MSARLDRLRPALALALALVLSAVVVVGIVGIVLPAHAPPKVAEVAPAPKPLTHHLLLVVVDGLRWDVASDPARMPRFSKALAEDASGQLMAGRVSMTTSAVLALGTGQRGSFEQVVRNVGPDATPFDSWLVQAKRAGLSVMTVGDPAWSEMYPRGIDEYRLDPKGVAIDVDFNPKTFRDARELRAKNPNVLVAHFVTPDPQAHAYTVPSRRYADHIRGFDRDLGKFLDELGPEWTVVVLGDHGAADSGTHGADVLIQRLSAVYATGAGIVRGAKVKQPIDQVDLAATFAALIGVPLPAHSRGHVLAEWLDTTPENRIAIACANARRALDFARASGVEVAPESAGCSDLAVARATTEKVDRAIEAKSGLSSSVVVPLLLVVVVLGALAALVALGGSAWPGVLAGIGMLAFGVFLTWGVERLPGRAPNQARLVLFVLGNLPALLLLLVPGRVGRWFGQTKWLAGAVVPGFLVATYTTNAQPEAYVAVVVGGLLLVFVGGLGDTRPTLARSRLMLHPVHLALFLVALAGLFFAGTRSGDLYPNWLRQNPPLLLGVAIALLALTCVALFARARPRRWVLLAVLSALGLGVALYLRRHIPPLPGRAAILAGLALTVWLAVRDKRLPALLAGLFTYCWISRDHEILVLAPTLLVADAAGAAYARHRIERGEKGTKLRFADLLLVSAFMFGLSFVQRIGIQGAIDFGAMDWGVAGFGDVHVSAWTVGLALGTKYALGMVLVLGAFASELGPMAADGVLAAAFVTFIARGVVLAAMFLVAGGSFWTGLRVLGDLPFGLLWAVGVALAWTAARYSSPPSSSS